MGTPIKDDDYVLEENAAWIETRGFAVRIRATDDGLSIEVFKSGAEYEPIDAPVFVPMSALESIPSLSE